MRALIVILAILWGCQSAPPALPPAPPKTMASLAMPGALPKRAAAIKVFRLLHTTPIPATDAIEAALARRSLLVEASEVNGEYQIALPGVYCNVVPMAPNDALHGRLDPSMIDRSSLATDEREAALSTSSAHQLNCEKDEGLPLRQLTVLAEEAVHVLMVLTDGWVYDPQTGRLWSKADWQNGRFEAPQYSIERAIEIEHRQFDGFHHLRTSGMQAFGMPELELPRITPTDVTALRQKLYTLADLFLDEFQDDFDGRVSLGAVEILALSRSTVEGAWGLGKQTQWGRKDPGKSVVLVSPNAPTTEVGAQTRFTQRLAQPD